MKKITFLFLTTCLIFTHLTIGYTQDADLDALRASDINADGMINILDLLEKVLLPTPVVTIASKML